MAVVMMAVAMMVAVKKQEEEIRTPTETIDDLLAESSRSDTTQYAPSCILRTQADADVWRGNERRRYRCDVMRKRGEW